MNRISIQAGVHHGRPCVAGTRITVEHVLELFRDGIPAEQITSEFYPDLEEADLRACLQYAIDVISAEELHFAEQG